MAGEGGCGPPPLLPVRGRQHLVGGADAPRPRALPRTTARHPASWCTGQRLRSLERTRSPMQRQSRRGWQLVAGVAGPARWAGVHRVNQAATTKRTGAQAKEAAATKKTGAQVKEAAARVAAKEGVAARWPRCSLRMPRRCSLARSAGPAGRQLPRHQRQQGCRGRKHGQARQQQHQRRSRHGRSCLQAERLCAWDAAFWRAGDGRFPGEVPWVLAAACVFQLWAVTGQLARAPPPPPALSPSPRFRQMSPKFMSGVTQHARPRTPPLHPP